MSLGIRSLWRARNLKVHTGGLSPIPREQYNPPFFPRSSPRQWYSTPVVVRRIIQPAKPKSISAIENEHRKNMIRANFGAKPMEPGLIKRPFRYRNKRLARQSLRQFRRSVARQILYDATHKASGKPTRNWRAAMAFMLMVTPNQGEILHFRVIIGKDVAEKAREILSGPDTHISGICRKNESLVQMVNEISKDGQLIFNLSGSEVAVRNSLREIIGVVGSITAVRISDRDLRNLMFDSRKNAEEGQSEIPFLRGEEVGDTTINDMTMTVKRSPSSTTHSIYKPYILNQRADAIPMPTKWTKTSFEEYVAALVYGQVPNHLARALYPKFPDHQHTVVELLVNLFLNRVSRPSISLSATKMAISFMESSGHGLRPLSHLIYWHVRTLGIPLDAELYTTFLVNASKAKNINTFNRLLRVMVRRGYAPQSRAWVAFLAMMPRPSIKRYIVGKLRERNLDQNPMILRAVGREMATVDLEYELLRRSTPLPTTSSAPLPPPPVDFDIRSFIDEQNDKYGIGWLDTITLNKMLDVLGKHDLLDACKTLLGVVRSAKYTMPDAATLNTLLSRTKGFAKQMAILKTIFTYWHFLKPDEGTYHLLFRLAWQRRYPNMIRVVWRYAVHERKTSSKMRYTLSKLLKQTGDFSSRTKFLKEWEDVIIGQTILSEIRASYPDGFHARHLFPKYLKNGLEPAVDFIVKLQEAVAKDMKIHRLLKEGKAVDKRSLSVPIPLKRLEYGRTQTSDAPKGLNNADVLRNKYLYDEMAQNSSQTETKTRKGNEWVIDDGE
ncbi:hypothetical protein F5B19DRAFT_456672 [Rostrohypoxylon terebratum]|nr:hypothetical protein F5B19DRAFT_456672 [Rostrohypoxylon terebratum]